MLAFAQKTRNAPHWGALLIWLFELFKLPVKLPLLHLGLLQMRYHALICVAALVCFPGLVHAGDLTFTQSFVANFDFDVLGGTPINPGPATGFQPYEAIGALTFTLDSSINDPSQTTVPFTNVTGTLNGVYPSSLVPYTISPDVQFIGGDLTNIVRNGSGNVISADVSDLSMRWDLIAFGGALTLFTLRRFAIRRFHHIHSVLVRHGAIGSRAIQRVFGLRRYGHSGGIWGESNPDRRPRAGLRHPGGSGSLGHGSRYGAFDEMDDRSRTLS